MKWSVWEYDFFYKAWITILFVVDTKLLSIIVSLTQLYICFTRKLFTACSKSKGKTELPKVTQATHTGLFHHCLPFTSTCVVLTADMMHWHDINTMCMLHTGTTQKNVFLLLVIATCYYVIFFITWKKKLLFSIYELPHRLEAEGCPPLLETRGRDTSTGQYPKTPEQATWKRPCFYFPPSRTIKIRISH